jgi:hypothetical protein
MNSFSELNGYSSELVSFQSQNDYNIVWANSLGNANIIANVSVSHNLPDQQPLVSFTNPLKPLCVAISSPRDIEGIALSNVVYTGNNANISLTHPNELQWVATGMWTVSDYNELFNNTTVSINSLRTEDFAYEVAATDQLGSTRDFFVNVDVVPFGFSRPTSVTYNEDSNATISGMAITDIANSNYTFTFTLSSAAAGNLVLNYNAQTGNVLTFTEDRDQCNTILADNITYVPADDFVANSNVSVNIYNNTTSEDLGTSNIALIIGSTHADFTAPTSIPWSKTGNSSIYSGGDVNLAITDLAVNRQYTANLTLASTASGNIYLGDTFYGNIISLSGNITQVNANIANLKFVPNAASNTSTTLQYVQTQTTAGINQANVSISMAYQPEAIHINSGGIELPVGSNIAAAGSDFFSYQFPVLRIGQSAPSAQYRSIGTYGAANGDNYSTFPTFGLQVPGSAAPVRNTSIYRYGPMSIDVSYPRGLQGEIDTSITDTGPAYFAFWIYLKQAHPFSTICYLNDGTAVWRGFCTFNNNLYFVQGGAEGQVGAGNNLVPHVPFGSLPIETWTHIAVQKGNNNESFACWKNGQPITSFYNFGGVAMTATGFANLYTMKAFTQFIFGAPLDVYPPGDGGYGGFNNSNGQLPLNTLLDDIVIRNDTPYTPGVAFTPTAQVWEANSRQLMTGV